MIPNIISLARLLAVPFLVILLCKQFFIGGALLIALCAFSDVLDGYLARRFRWETTTGIILDPLADKLLVYLAFTIGSLPAASVVARLDAKRSMAITVTA